MSKLYITEKEFDMLNQYEQMKYYFCPHCGDFYIKKKLQSGCKHGRCK